MSTVFVHAAGDCEIIRLPQSTAWSVSESGIHFHAQTPATARALRDAFSKALERLDAKHPDAKVFANGEAA